MPVTVSAPPERKAKPSAATSNTTSRKAKERAEGLDGIGQLLTAGLLFARQPADAIATQRHWPKISLECAKLGDDNPKVGEFLDNLNTVGPYAGLIGAVLPLMFQVMVNHDRMQPEGVANMGVVPRNVMEAEAQAIMMKAEIEAMQYQMEVQQEAESARREYEQFQREHAENME